MSVNLSFAVATRSAEGADWPVLRRAATRLLDVARRLRPDRLLPALIGTERLSADLMRDAGLQAEQIGQAPIWGHGGIMWRT